jgi:hypothetical protein
VVNGTIVPANTIYQVSAAQLAQTTFVAGAAGTSDNIYVEDFDGNTYSGWNTHVNVSVAQYTPPTVNFPSGTSVTASTAGQALQFSTLFSGSDSNGAPLTYYLYDTNAAANSGHFVVNGTIVPANTIYQVSAAQLAQTTFVAGAAGTSDDIYVEDFDGNTYSGWNAHVNVSVAPIATAASLGIAGASSSAVTFLGATGTLMLDHSATFAGQPIGLTGHGISSSSDKIDLGDIAFGTGTTESYAGNSSGGLLTTTYAQDHAANISLIGNHTNSTFAPSSDGNGGTIVVDPPKDGFNFNFASNPAPANSPALPSVTVGGAGNDAFVFHQFASEHAGNPDTFALDGFASKAANSDLIAFARETQTDHQWIDAGHDASVGHPVFASVHVAQGDHFLVH